MNDIMVWGLDSPQTIISFLEEFIMEYQDFRNMHLLRMLKWISSNKDFFEVTSEHEIYLILIRNKKTSKL